MSTLKMRVINEMLRQLPEFNEMLERLEPGRPIAVGGLGRIHKAHFAAAAGEAAGRPVVILCADESEMTRLAADVSVLSGADTVTLPAREFTFYNAESVSREWEHFRLAALHSMVRGRAAFVVSTVEAVMQRTMPRDKMLGAAFAVKLGGEYDLNLLARKFADLGYSRCQQVEGKGQYALRGGILDFFSPSMNLPVRCEFFGNEIDSMGIFDIDTQRRIENITNADILPAAEVLPALHGGGCAGLAGDIDALIKKVESKTGMAALLSNLRHDAERLRGGGALTTADRYMALVYKNMESAADYIPGNAVVLISDWTRVAERAGRYERQLGQDAEVLLEAGVVAGELAEFSYGLDELREKLERRSLALMESFISSFKGIRPSGIINVAAKQLSPYGGKIDVAAAELSGYLSDGFKTVILSPDEHRAKNLAEILRKKGVTAPLDLSLGAPPAAGKAVVALGALSEGMEYPSIKTVIMAEGQMPVPQKRKASVAKSDKTRQKLYSYADLSPGDLVVHEHHGIGRFIEISKMKVDDVERDYIKIAYAGSDSLYLPATQLDLVSKYIGGGEGAAVRLNKLGGAEWSRTKTRAKSAARDLAKGLIELYAERQRQKGYAFSPDSSWQLEFEESFEYEQTDGQRVSTEEIKKDMESPIPMDRLLCGDVGYGKTEVALRGVMKCVLDGKQAAILVPTTVLASQHYGTCQRRFAGYPVRLEVLSRFLTPSQSRRAAERIKNGSVDLVIGTHRLLQGDIEFYDLGLLIIDEEQRFGVSHKERLKEMSRQVDVLTLSATPIPRTLNMALSGLRDMSTIEEPPGGRYPVQTYVMEHDWSVIADAIRREISRSGQVYYLHNRIETISRTAARLAAMLGGVKVAAAHGQMNEDELADVMEKMVSGEISVLVCTTIIETGIDIPNVNTLIIEDADKLGLAQLHQIRGRVGRSSTHAFAYMTYRRGKAISEVAAKRLSAVREFTEFGSGFRIAMRDLEIRGAGNLLGAEQSGHMVSVGYEMYLKLLEEAVLEERGQKTQKRADCVTDLSVSANIPEKYIASGEQRMDLYRRIAQIRTGEDSLELFDELADRFGSPPESVNTLIAVSLLRAQAAEAGISEILQKGDRLTLSLVDTDLKKISALCGDKSYKGRLLFSAGERPYLMLRLGRGEDVLPAARRLVEDYKDVKFQ